MKVSAERLTRSQAARDCALRIIRKTECWKTIGPIKAQTAELGDLKMVHRTPFSSLSDIAAAPSYQHALTKQAASPDLPYALDIWFQNKKVLFVQWDQSDELQVISFRPGEWETRLAAACRAEQ